MKEKEMGPAPKTPPGPSALVEDPARVALRGVIARIRKTRVTYLSKNGANYSVRFTDEDLRAFQKALEARSAGGSQP